MKSGQRLNIIAMFVILLCTILSFTSCSKDDEKDTNRGTLPSYILDGTWIAETDAWYFYITFDKSGTFEYDSESKRGSQGTASGTYTYDSKSCIITCVGYVGTVYTDGDVQTGDFNAQFKYDEKEKTLERISSGTKFSKGTAYDNKDHSMDFVCDYCGGTGRCGMCNSGICTFCNGKGGETEMGRWWDCRHCDNGRCSYCKGTGNCLECNGTGNKK